MLIWRFKEDAWSSGGVRSPLYTAKFLVVRLWLHGGASAQFETTAARANSEGAGVADKRWLSCYSYDSLFRISQNL